MGRPRRKPIYEQAAKWGVEPWETRDGLTPKEVQKIIRECVQKAGAEYCSRLLRVGIYAIETYLENETTIPLYVGEHVREMHKICFNRVVIG